MCIIHVTFGKHVKQQKKNENHQDIITKDFKRYYLAAIKDIPNYHQRLLPITEHRK
jgi:hypothetical protein